MAEKIPPPISELVRDPTWQTLRRSFLGTWKKSPVENVSKLREYLGSMDDLTKIRIVMNYLTGTGFRTGKIDHPEIRRLRSDLVQARLKLRE